jgi:hypothetical protein
MSSASSGRGAIGGKATLLQLKSRKYDCLELYLPKKLKHLSSLYEYLGRRLSEGAETEEGAFAIDGFSIYEVDGAWRGQEVTDERTLVVRVLLLQTRKRNDRSLRSKIMQLGQDIATIAPTENEILICHYVQEGFSIHP